MNSVEHLLTCLAEEGVEIAKDVSKALRFGLDDRNVLNPDGPTNRERLVDELNDLMAAVDILVERRILPLGWLDPDKKWKKKAKVVKFMDYAVSKGALT